MKTKLLLTFALALPLLLVTSGFALAQTGGAASTKTKIAFIDAAAFRTEVGELRVKFEKLQAEFAPRDRELQAMRSKLAAQEKTLNENQNLTPQQAAKLTEEFEQGKKEFTRMGEDFQAMINKREDEETGPIKEKLSKFLEQYCAKYGITYVFEGRALQETGIIIYAAPTANITDDFIKEYNKANPAPAGAASAK